MIIEIMISVLLTHAGYRVIVPYLIGNQESGKQPLPPKAELQWRYQFYFATERGRIGYEKNRFEAGDLK